MNINAIKNGVRKASPRNFPINVKGTIIATAQITIINKYTVFDAWLSINGIFAVLIMCKPIRFDTIPYENHIV